MVCLPVCIHTLQNVQTLHKALQYAARGSLNKSLSRVVSLQANVIQAVFEELQEQQGLQALQLFSPLSGNCMVPLGAHTHPSYTLVFCKSISGLAE